MGTLFTITLYATDETLARHAANAAFAKVAELNQVMTDYDPESELMRLSRSPVGVPVRVSEALFEILAESQRLAQLSDGAFDVTIGPVIRLWRRAGGRKLANARTNRPCPRQCGLAKAPARFQEQNNHAAGRQHATRSGRHRQRLCC